MKPIRQIRIDGDVAYVPLTKGLEATIDAEDAHLVDGFNWFSMVTRRSDGSIRHAYAARRSGFIEGKQRLILMHRVIAETPDGLETDHKDSDGLNNRKSNLRHATKSQNAFNRRLRTGSRSGRKGVGFHRNNGKYHAYINIDGKRTHLGHFETLEAASAAYEDASKKHHGEFGRIV